MTLKLIYKEQTIAALLEYRKKFDGTDTEFASIFEISASVYSQMKKGKVDKLISDDKLVTIARKLGVNIKGGVDWSVVKTETYMFIEEMLTQCKQRSVGRIFCDISDLGKTVTAEQFMLQNENVFIIDCSQVKTRTMFVRRIAKALGINQNKNIPDLILEVTLMLQGMDKPLIILDEAGDLEYPAFLELKALYNSLRGFCGWCLMGANGLKAKLDRGVRSNKVGYEEIVSRYGGEIYRATPVDIGEQKRYMRRHAEDILRANMPGTDLNTMMPGKISLRRLQENVLKTKNNAA